MPAIQNPKTTLPSRPEKAVQFAKENTIIIEEDHDLGKGQTTAAAYESYWLHDQPASILKNGAKKKEKVPKNIVKLNAISDGFDDMIKQQNESRQFFEQFTERLNQKEQRIKQKLAESWQRPEFSYLGQIPSQNRLKKGETLELS